MGFLKHLLFWPVTGPAFLTRFSLDRVQGVVRDELTDDARIKEALLDLQLRMELDEIGEEEYLEEEARLMAELREIRRWREEFGMATRGGVVQVGDAEGGPGAPGTGPPAGVAPAAGADEELAEPDEGRHRTDPEERDASPAVPPGATLEVTLDWDEDGDAAEEEDDGWDESSRDDSTPASS